MCTPPTLTFLPLMYLPQELIHDIIDLAARDFKTALSLVLTSKQFSIWATPRLYEKVFIKDQVALNQFKAALDACPSRSDYVKALSLVRFQMDSSDLLDFVNIINRTPHVSHLTWRLFNSPLPAEAFPASLRRLDVHYMDFHPFSWNSSYSFPSSVNIEILQIASGIDWETPLLQHISLVPFTSLKYLHLHSGLSIRLSGLNTWLSAVLVPQFPASLRVCLIYDPVYTGNRFISREMKALILGDVDDRILVCTDDRIRVSPRGVLHDYLIRWYNDVVPTFIDPFPSLSNVSNSNPRNNPNWKELELLVQRRRAQREKWLQIFSPGRTTDNEGHCRIIDYPYRKTTFERANYVALYVPAFFVRRIDAIWKRLK